MSNYQELLAQREALSRQAAELERQLKEMQRSERLKVITQVKELMAANGLTIADLEAGAKRVASGTGRSATAGTKVAAKYRNNDTGETWTGRGIKPKWLQAAIAGGKSLEDFAI